MKTTILLVAVLALAGCASYSELQSKPPISEFSVTQSADAYMGCVAPKLREIFGTSATVLPEAGGHVLSVANGKHAVLSVTVTPEGSGAHVVYRQTLSVNSGNYRKAAAVVESCR